jgi:hypothetical protein
MKKTIQIPAISIFILLTNSLFLFSGIGDEHGEKSTPAMTLYIGSNIGSNYFFLGQSHSGNKPYYSSDMTLMLKNGMWFSGAIYHLTDYKPFIGSYDLSVGWLTDFNKWLDGGFSVSRLVYPPASQEDPSIQYTYYQFQAGADWRVLYTSISAGVLVVEESEFYFQLKNSRYFQTGNILNGAAYFSFDPGISFLAGTISEWELSTAAGGIGGRGRRQPTTTTTYSTPKSFKWMDVEISLPIGFSWKSFSIEPCLTYYYPFNLPDEIVSNKGFYVYASLYLKI